MSLTSAFPASGLLIHQAKTSLGWAAIAASPQGICGLVLGDSPDEVLLQICTLHRRSRIDPWPANQGPDLNSVLEHLDDSTRVCQVPLHLIGTPFQQAVWSQLRDIPAGSTLSYSALAQQLGRPGSARAVAAACAANPVAVIVPCHRVVGQNGQLTGYRWGLERKAELLRREALQAAVVCA